MQFGSLLAHADKKVRDEAIQSLEKYITENELGELEWLKLWKGLYYCYWMSDKTKIQLELAKKISKLLMKVKGKNVLLFLNGFYKTLEREWNGIDARRLDKFYSFSRIMLQAILGLAMKEQDIVLDLVILLKSRVLNFSNPALSLGLLYHSTEALVEEMINVGNYDSNFLDIYYEILMTRNRVLYERVLEVFEKIFKHKHGFKANETLEKIESIVQEKDRDLIDSKALKTLIIKWKNIVVLKETQRKLLLLKKRKSSSSLDSSPKEQGKRKKKMEARVKKSVQWLPEIKNVKVFNKKTRISLSKEVIQAPKSPLRSILRCQEQD